MKSRSTRRSKRLSSNLSPSMGRSNKPRRQQMGISIDSLIDENGIANNSSSPPSTLDQIAHPPSGSAYRRVGVVGGGFSGLSFCLQLHEKLRGKALKFPIVEVLLFESGAVVGPGVAFAVDNEEHSFRLNTPIDSMNAYANRSPGQFRLWLEAERKLQKEEGANKSDSVPTTKGSQEADREEENFPLRKDYGRYLIHLAEELKQVTAPFDTHSPVRVRFLTNTRVEDVTRTTSVDGEKGKFRLHTADGAEWAVELVVLATGLFPVSLYRELVGQPGYSHDHHSHARVIASLRGDEAVGVVGTHLSAIDIAVELERRGHCGKIVMGSRHGHLPPVFSPVSILAFPSPQIEDARFENSATLTANKAILPHYDLETCFTRSADFVISAKLSPTTATNSEPSASEVEEFAYQKLEEAEGTGARQKALVKQVRYVLVSEEKNVAGPNDPPGHPSIFLLGKLPNTAYSDRIMSVELLDPEIYEGRSMNSPSNGVDGKNTLAPEPNFASLNENLASDNQDMPSADANMPSSKRNLASSDRDLPLVGSKFVPHLPSIGSMFALVDSNSASTSSSSAQNHQNGKDRPKFLYYRLTHLHPLAIPRPIRLADLADRFFLEVLRLYGAAPNVQKTYSAFMDHISRQSMLAYLDEQIACCRSGELKPWQIVMMALYKLIPRLWLELADTEKRIFLDEYGTAFSNYFGGFPLVNALKIRGMLASGQLEVWRGLEQVVHDEGEGGGFVMCSSPSGHVLFNASGMGSDAREEPLYARMIQRSLVDPHPYGGVKIHPSTLETLNVDGAVNKGLFALGEATKGHFMSVNVVARLAAQADKVATVVAERIVLR